MALIIKAGGDFTPAPEGLWPGVCVDVVDKGIVKSAMYKPRHMLQLRWILNAEPPLPDGRPHMAVRSFGASLHEQSALRPFLEAWRGKKFTKDELDGFDLERLLGVNCQLQLIHNITEQGKTYANIQAAVPLGRGMLKMHVSEGYVRVKDRAKEQGTAGGPGGEEEEVPF